MVKNEKRRSYFEAILSISLLTLFGLNLYFQLQFNTYNTEISNLTQSQIRLESSIGQIVNNGATSVTSSHSDRIISAERNGSAWIANVSGWSNLYIQMPNLAGPTTVLFSNSQNGTFVEATGCTFDSSPTASGPPCRNSNMANQVVFVPVEGQLVEITDQFQSSDPNKIAIFAVG